jgi:hypothetical protein
VRGEEADGLGGQGLHCGESLVMGDSVAWDTTIQPLDRGLSIASRPGHCPKAPGRGSRRRLLSAAAQRLAPPGSTYGDDGLVHMGWLRQPQRATSRESHTASSARLSLSAAHGRARSPHDS